MAIWRSAEVEAILGGTLDEAGMSAATLERLVEERVPEREQVEFKGRCYDRSTAGNADWTTEQEFAKDVSALANHRGGVLILGLSEKAGFAHSLTPLTSSPEKEEQRLRAALANHMAPFAVVDFVPVQVAGGFAVVLVVPPSLRAPHAVLTKHSVDGRRPLRYPVRHGTDTRWLDGSEVASRYVRRLRAGELEASRLATVVDQGTKALQLAASIWLCVSIVPEIGAIERINRQTVFANGNWVDQQDVESPFGDAMFSGLRTTSAPGRTIVGRQSDVTDPTMKPDDVHLELYADGSVSAAAAVTLHTDGSHSAHDVRAVGLQTLTRDEIPLLELGGRWVAHQAAVGGSAQVEAGLFDADSLDGRFGVSVELQSTGSGEMQRTPNSRRLRDVTPTVQTVYDLTGPLTTQGVVAVASVVIDGLFQWFGLSDCPFLERNGSILVGP